MKIIIVSIIAYILGSMPYGLLFARLKGIKDIRQHGSGNIGATNVLRIAGKKAAIVTLLADIGKAVIAVLLGKLMGSPYIAAIAVVAGHIWPAWLNFRGGKGVATAIGALLVLSPIIALTVVILWVIILAITRIVSLASIIAAASVPIFALISTKPLTFFIACGVISLMVIYKHKDNIARLKSGEEPKIM